MPSRTETAGHTKAIDYPVMGHSCSLPIKYMYMHIVITCGIFSGIHNPVVHTKFNIQ